MHQELPTRRNGGTRRTFTVIGLAAGAALAFAAYRFFTNRSGEAAIQYIPADATLVATFDGTPSPAQVAVFARIESALNREGVSDSMADFFDKNLSGNALAKDIKPYMSRNFAAAMWNGQNRGGAPEAMSAMPSEGAIFIAISDPGKVQAALQKDCQPGPETELYRLGGSPMLAGVLDKYLVLCSGEARYNQIVKVSKGELPSVGTLTGYKDARAALPSDSNLMVFVSPDLYKSANVKIGSNAWFSMGAAVRDQGLAVSFRYPAASNTLGKAPALDQAVLKELPDGAYGVLCYSDPSTWYEAVRQQGGSTQTAISDANNQMRSNTGLDLYKDVIPAVKGDFELAVYPSSDHRTTPQFLLMFGSEHGADPLALAQKLRTSIEEHKDKWGGATVSERQDGSATVWTILNPNTKPAGYEDNPFSSGVDVVLLNKAVYVSSSAGMTSRLVDLSRGSGQSLADDTPFTSMAKTVKPNAQSILMVSMFRILGDVVRRNPDAAKWRTILGGANTGIVGSTSYSGATGVGELFVPLDWDKTIKLMGESTRKTGTSSPGIVS